MTIEHARQIFGKLWPTFRSYKKVFVVLSFLSLGAQAAKILTMTKLGGLIESFGSDSTGERYGFARLLFCAFLLERCVSKLQSIYSYSRLLYPIEHDMYMVAMEKKKELSMSQVIGADSGSTSNTIRNGVEAIRYCFDRMFNDVIPITWSFLIIVPALFVENWQLGAVGLAGFLFYLYDTLRLNGQMFVRMQEHTTLGTKVELSYFDAVHHWKLIKSSGEEERIIGRLDSQIRAYCKDGSNQLSRFFAESLWRSEAIAVLTLGILLVIEIRLYGQGTISISGVVNAIMWSVSMFFAMGGIGNIQRMFLEKAPHISGYYGFLGIPTVKIEERYPISMESLSGDIVFEDVSSRKLKHVSFTVKGKSMAVIVGPSGAGKTTLMLLLAGWIHDYTGKISIGGRDLREIPRNELFKKIRIMPQSPEYLHIPLRDNMKLGLNGMADTMTDAMLMKAAEKLFVNSDWLTVERLNQVVGDTDFKPSGGELQRVAITRAVLPKPSILICDEPTSAFDPANEELVRDAILEAGKGRTCLIIAHKIATARRADMVIVLGNGQIVRTGTHQELMDQGCIEYMWLVQREQASALMEETL